MRQTHKFIFSSCEITVTPRLLGWRWEVVAADTTGMDLFRNGSALTLDRAVRKAMQRADGINERIRLRKIMFAHWAERWDAIAKKQQQERAKLTNDNS
jgi:hypothetical protein